MFGVKRNTGTFISEEKDYVTETVQQLKEEVRATRRQYVSTLSSGFVWKLVFNHVVCVYIESVCVLDYNSFRSLCGSFD